MISFGDANEMLLFILNKNKARCINCAGCNKETLSDAYVLPSASSVESGSSFLLVSGRRKPRAPLTSVRLLKTTVGMDQWYTANMLSSGASRPPTLLAMEPKPEAVCLKHSFNRISQP